MSYSPQKPVQYALKAKNATDAEFATTASYALSGPGAGGVTQIVAGSDISISPGSGVGVVTINSTAGSASTGSLLITASFSNPNITFTKGNGSTFTTNLITLVPTNASTASLALSASYLIGGGSGLAAGPNTSIQFNDGGNLSGSGNFTLDKVNNFLFITGGLNISNQNGSSSLTITSGSNKVFTVTGSGVVVFGTFNSPPPVEEGGLYFNGVDFFIGS